MCMYCFRGMLSSRSLLAQFMNNTNNVMNPQAKRPVTSVAGSSLFQGLVLQKHSFNFIICNNLND